MNQDRGKIAYLGCRKHVSYASTCRRLHSCTVFSGVFFNTLVYDIFCLIENNSKDGRNGT